jgi:hypothetical protein
LLVWRSDIPKGIVDVTKRAKVGDSKGTDSVLSQR